MTAEKRAVIWSDSDCPLCDRAFAHLLEEGYSVEKKDVNKLMSGEDPNTDAMVQLTLQSMSLPIIELNGNFIRPGDLYDE